MEDRDISEAEAPLVTVVELNSFLSPKTFRLVSRSSVGRNRLGV